MVPVRIAFRAAAWALAAAMAGAPAAADQVAQAAIGKDVKGSYAKRELRNEDFRGQDLRGADFTFANLRNAAFAGADLRGAILHDCFCYEADFTGADLRGAKLLGAKFGDAKMTRANLEDQELYLAGADIHFQMSEEARRNWTVREAFKPNLNNGRLTFQAANLRNAKILGNLEGVDFRRADLRGADLSKATNLHTAVLRGAVYDGGTKWNVDAAEAGAVRGEDVGPGSKWFVGLWGIEKERPGEPPAPKTGRLKLSADGTYEWDDGTGKPVTGRWETIGEGGKTRIRLLKGELGADWIGQPAKEDLILKSGDGKRTRTAFRG
jgi:uncharacterized protein YjbI with pentapeptide repeats